MGRVARISVSLPKELLEKFDKVVKEIGLDRSKTIQKALRAFISEHIVRKGGKGAGAIIYVYDHTVKDSEHNLIKGQHGFRDIITSTMHVHLDDRRCLEIAAVHGDIKRIMELSRRIARNKGVQQLKQITLSV